MLLASTQLLVLLALLPGAPAAPAQTRLLPDSTQAARAARPQKLLLKLGTGLTRGYELGGFSGLSLPVALGAEVALRPGWNLSANGFGGIYLFGGGNSRSVGPNRLGFDAGIRRYYNLAKRQQKGRKPGPFSGNYVALQSTTHWVKTTYLTPTWQYKRTSVALVWGLQRRLGGHGLLDAYLGLGLTDELRDRHDTGSALRYERYPPTLVPEAAVKLSLVL
ncbi:hypothetical protein [Hymenobacter chitinivorans]|nr:hypothetical protein [Hymenobacter chitinivorans]